MIDRLTPAQETMLAEVREEWLAAGLSTQPADRPAAEDGVRAAYRAAGLEPPGLMLWLRSPLEGCVAAAQVRDQVWDQVRAQVRDQVRDQVWVQVGAQVWAQVRDQVRDQVWDQVRAQVRDQVRDQVWDQVRAQVGDQVGAQVWVQVGAQVWAQVRDQVRDQVGLPLWGQHDAGWLGWVDAMTRLGVSGTEAVGGLATVARSAGWWWAFAGIAILTERPVTLHRDERGRLHHDSGPAIAYPDGWGVWAWHGVRVPREVIEAPETLTAAAIRDEANAEVRRVMLERFGHARYVRDIGATALHQDTDGLGHPRILWSAPRPEDSPLVMVEVVNSTPEPDGSRRSYWLRVPPTMRTCQEAVAWTFGVEAREYAPAAES